jgi:2'-5' RNA ligase
MSLFIAVELASSTMHDGKPKTGSDVRHPFGGLAAAVDSLTELGRSVKPVPPYNLHLTLKFLGTVPRSAVASACGILKTVAAGHKPFRFTVAGTGVFPRANAPRVIWAGVEHSEQLQRLALALDRAVAAIGIPPESRPFHPHVTLARIRNRAPGNLADWLRQRSEVSFGTVFVDHISLMQSSPAPTGAAYRVVSTAALQPQ